MKVFLNKILKNKSVCFFCILIINVIINISIISVRQDTAEVKESYFTFLLWSLLAITLGPLVEEIAFRLPLKRGKYNWVSLIFLFIIIIGSFKIPLLCIGHIIFMGIIIVNYFYMNKLIKILLIVLSVVNFGYLHLFVYEDVVFFEKNILELSTLVAPQLLAGIALVFMRLRGSFWLAVSYHSAYNFTTLAIIIAYSYFTTGSFL